MKKTNKKTTTRNTYRNHIDLPEVVDMDVLSYAPDEDLDRRLSYLAAERDRMYHAGVDTQPWEEEICYVQREVRVRAVRRQAHDRYLRTHSDYSNSAVSFDNLHFSVN